MLVYTTGRGVYGFTLDPSIGEFCLSQHYVQTPETGPYYSTNEGYLLQYSEGVRRYIAACQGAGEAGQGSKKSLKGRYIGSLVADFHRNLLKGGIYLYPPTQETPNGKLRLLYECNPIALIAEQAGGIATDGTRRILEIEPTSVHQRTPFFVGSARMVRDVMRSIRDHDSPGQ